MSYDGTHKYEVVFVDEYDNWWLLGFFDDLREAEPLANDFLKNYEAEDEDEGQTGPIWLGPDSPFGGIEEYAGTFDTCFDRQFYTPCGCVQIRGFVLL